MSPELEAMLEKQHQADRQVPSYYEINVSKDGHHLFATHKRSIVDRNTLDVLRTLFREKFPATEGYEVRITAEYRYGRTIEPE